MMNQLPKIAEAILNSDFNAQEKLHELMKDLKQVGKVFSEAHLSSKLLFVASEIFSKHLNNYEYYELTDFLHNNEPDSHKIRIFSSLIVRIYELANKLSHEEKYVVNSCINTISLIMRVLLEVERSSETIKNLLQILNLSPVSICPQNQTNEKHVVVLPLKVHENVRKIFEYWLSNFEGQNIYPDNGYFYQSISVMEKIGLKIMLELTVGMVKGFFNKEYEQFQSLFLLERIVMFPFGLTRREVDHFEEFCEDICGCQYENDFPPYFKYFLIHEQDFFTKLVQYFSYVIESYELSYERTQLVRKSIIRIICRCFCMSLQLQEPFNTTNIRTRGIEFFRELCFRENYEQPYLVNNIIDFAKKYIKSYLKDLDFQIQSHFILLFLAFSEKVIINTKIHIIDAGKNCFNRVFQLLYQLSKIYGQNMTGSLQKIILIFYQRITNSQQIEQDWEQFGDNNQDQIESFEEMFEYVKKCIKVNIHQNFNTICQMDLSLFDKRTREFWLHFMSVWVCEQYIDKHRQADVIAKFLVLSLESKTVAGLKFINAFVTQALGQIEDPLEFRDDQLLNYLLEKLDISFVEMFKRILAIVSQNLFTSHNTLVSQTLILYTNIYDHISIKKTAIAQPFYQQINQITNNIDKTMLTKEQYVNQRRIFFAIMGTMELKKDSCEKCFRFYNGIKNFFHQQNDKKFGVKKFFIDVAGLLSGTENSFNAKVLLQILYPDLELLFSREIYSNLSYFQDEPFLKICIKLMIQICNQILRFSHCSLGGIYHKLFFLFIRELGNPKYEIPLKETTSLWRKYLRLDPLSSIPLLPSSLKKFHGIELTLLLQEYFENLRRIDNQNMIEEIYSYVHVNRDLFELFWEEIMDRNIKVSDKIQKGVLLTSWTRTADRNFINRVFAYLNISLSDEKFLKNYPLK